MKHKVTFSVEDGCVFDLRVECLSEPGDDCLIGCPVQTCECGHSADGCDCCQDVCFCNCAVHPMGFTCGIPGVHQCECATRVEHGHGDACPHEFGPIEECWLLPWAEYNDADWFTEYENEDVYDMIRSEIVRDREEHPEEVWSVILTSYAGEPDCTWYPTEVDTSILTRESA